VEIKEEVYQWIDKKENLIKIKEIFYKKEFKKFLNAFKIAYTMDIAGMKLLNKDFWKEFI